MCKTKLCGSKELKEKGQDLTDVQKKMIYSRGKRVKMRRGKKQTFDQRHYKGKKKGGNNRHRIQECFKC